MKIMRATLRGIAYGTGAILLLIFLYFGVACLLTVIPVNASYVAPTQGISIYVQSNGVHTDFTLPVKHPIKDWTKQIAISSFTDKPVDFEYISFGWGDRGFYLETPTWADLRASVAFNALFLPSATAMHVTYEAKAPALDKNTRRLIISPAQYRELVNFIDSSFSKDSTSQFVLIEESGYPGYYNNFYEAKGYYHLFHTSNNWTNQGLKKIGIKTALWAPFDWCVLFHL